MTGMASLTTLPHEILHSIFKRVDITDIAALSISCGTLHLFISDNHMLFKDLYLQRLVFLIYLFDWHLLIIGRMNRLTSRKEAI
jgi:hypothetical protein